MMPDQPKLASSGPIPHSPPKPPIWQIPQIVNFSTDLMIELIIRNLQFSNRRKWSNAIDHKHETLQIRL